MILRGKWMIPKADGTGYEELAAEKLSDMVTYSNTTLANALENFEEDLTALGEKQDHSKILDKLSALNFSENKIIYSVDSDTLTTSPITETGKKILSIGSFENFRHTIKAPTAEIFLWDETEKVVWQKVGSPYLSTDNARFYQALQCSVGNYVWSSVTLGGQDFTIDACLYYLNNTSGYYNANVLDLGDFKLSAYQYEGANSIWRRGFMALDSSNNRLDFINQTWNNTRDYLSESFFHLEIGYSNGTLYFFFGGNPAYKATISRTISRAARQIILGGATCSISEFRILDGVCLHTGNFSVPTAPYELTDETISLLHFNESY